MLRTSTEDPASGAAQPMPAEPIIVVDVRTATTDVTGIVIDPFATLRCTGGRDGLLALAVDDFVGSPTAPDDDLVARRGQAPRPARPGGNLRNRTTRHTGRPGETGERESDHGAGAVCPRSVRMESAARPRVRRRETSESSHPPSAAAELFRIQSEMILQCERKRDRFALLDPPIDAVEGTLGGIRPIQEWRSRFDTQFAAIYFPWIRVLDPLAPTTGAVRAIPPSGHVAGVVAATDLDSGVHHAPANRRVEWALDTSDRRRRRTSRHPELARDQRCPHHGRARATRAGCTYGLAATPTGASSTCAGSCR